MKARVTVTLKPGVLDPQGKAIAGALASLGIDGIASVRQGKLFDLELAGGDPAAARAALEQACTRLLANTVVENFQVEIEETAPPAAAVPPPGTGHPDPAAATEIAARDAEMPTEGHP